MPPITLNVTKELRGPSLLLDCTINCFQDYHNEIKSKVFTIDNLGMVQLNFSFNTQVLSVEFSSRRYCPNVKTNVRCSELGYSAQTLEDSPVWEKIGVLSMTSSCNNTKLFLMKLSVTMSKQEPIQDVYGKFYKDTELIDFKLCTANGESIGFHKLILSANSEVFRTMLNGEWTETSTGQINIEGVVTVHTLKDLKDFMYMGVLPEIGLRPLLVLAKRYLMNNLKKKCIQKIVETVTSRNLYTVLEFACKRNIPELTFAILCTTPSSTVHAVYQSRKSRKLLETDW